MTKSLTEEEFDDKFTIILQSDDFHAIKQYGANHVWTIMEGDDSNLYLSPGFRVVNKIGYVVTVECHDFKYDEVVWCIFEEEEIGDE